MDLDILFLYVAGYEKVADDQYRLYVTGPVPKPQLHRRVGERMPLFHLFAGPDAERIEAWLARYPAWQCLRIPTYDHKKGSGAGRRPVAGRRRVGHFRPRTRPTDS